MALNPQSDFVTDLRSQIKQMRATRNALIPIRERAKLLGLPAALTADAFLDDNADLSADKITAAFATLDAVEVALAGPQQDYAPLRALLPF